MLQMTRCRVAERLLHRTEEVLRPYLQQYLVGVITGELMDTELKGSHHEVIFKVRSCNSQTTRYFCLSSWHLCNMQDRSSQWMNGQLLTTMSSEDTFVMRTRAGVSRGAADTAACAAAPGAGAGPGGRVTPPGRSGPTGAAVLHPWLPARC